ncbi:putative enoyl-CoA hydratase/isomerase [Actinoplanes missouriensis 431]|uniref:Putative enoyl-CoA hydratase/isomerase n=1 Tax=Actinoplanes missouriensis (strain ATCC 14538 / DSM 43046 / CBS 188.64 / JCM 3121 / NBRC 102363 / NCIMB 12654 / NRRL B-3342 / UNCC 431) TaxID=512565 RepID=I0HB70_ACTM4|nr:enoyl-CoA hydratase-related protein [Actinoplanes missouriensis]BAL90257.1 putative enoyl-CoA hydratase/isomerase [Actinoplanes missouriensis 431]
MTAPRLTADDRTPGVVRLSLPGAAGRLDDDLLGALLTEVGRAENTSGVRVLVLGAAGGTFCPGMALDVDTVDWRPRIAAIETLLRRLTTSPLVTVAVVDGPATGGGVGLAAACDHVIAGERARFRLTEVLLGLVPAVILPVLARRMGAHRAYSLALTAREFDGAEAGRLGLADHCTTDPDGELRRVLTGLRRADHAAIRALKRYYTGHLDASAGNWEPAAGVLARRFADPSTRQRLAGLRRHGLIP